MISALSLQDIEECIVKNENVVVMFTQPRTCAPCRQLKPHFQAASEKSDATFVVVDLDVVPDAAVEYNVRGVPQVFLYRNGKYDKTIVGRTVVQILSELN